MWGYSEYIPVARKKATAAKQLEKQRKKNPNIRPVVISGNKIARTWWGIAWNKNLESYADYDNRIRRGRSYVRNGMVLDLQIEPGLVAALVMGSGSKPYQIEITINSLADNNWKKITDVCSHSIANIEELVSGKFPESLGELFTQKGAGLFPAPKEIKFNCDCPDWADMCKHVAAALYGVSVRLDEEPLLFFKLRNVPFESLLKKSVEAKMQSMLENSGKKSKRVIKDADIGDLFGI